MSKRLRSARAASDPLRARLFRDLVLLILITVGVLAAASALLINDLKRDFAKARIKDASALVRDEVSGLLLPVRQQLLILRDGLRNRGLTPDDLRDLNEQLMPPLVHMDQIAGASFADAAGRDYFLRREGKLWITRQRPASALDADSPPTQLSLWLDDDQLISSREESSSYDPRQRPWFEGAVQRLADNPEARSAAMTDDADPAIDAELGSGAESATGSGSSQGFGADAAPDLAPSGGTPVTWSLPYQFDWQQEPGITAATAWRDQDDLLVLALDVTLARILATVETFRIGAGGRGFLFDREGGIYGLADEQADASGFYNAARHQGGTTAFEAIAAWRAADEPDETPIHFESGGQHWWGGFVPLEPARRNAWVGVLFPSTGPLDLFQARWPLFTGIALAILGLGISLALLVVRRYSHRLQELPKLAIDRSAPERDLYELIGRGESAHLEFKSTMRLNLRSGKNDKAIELAWLKGVAAFLNTEGGILLLGVADDGELLGLAGDGFANDDKCLLHFKNLVNQHLGAEAMRDLQLTLFWLDDKQIGAIECAPADAPVYLRQGNSGESFLIRTGPSNSELPISRALSYIASRF